MAGLTFRVNPPLLVTPSASVRKGAVTPSNLEEFPGTQPLSAVVRRSRHWSHLSEAPMLVYAVCPIVATAELATPGLLLLGWSLVATRLVHKRMRLTVNAVMLRLAAFGHSQIGLAAIWLIAFFCLLGVIGSE